MVQKWISCPKRGCKIKFSLRMKYSSKIKFGPNEISVQNWNGESITIWHGLKIASQNCPLNRESPPFVIPYCWRIRFLPHIKLILYLNGRSGKIFVNILYKIYIYSVLFQIERLILWQYHTMTKCQWGHTSPYTLSWHMSYERKTSFIHWIQN